MKKILGFLIVMGMAANSYALTETIQKVYQGVQDLKTNLQDAASAVSAGDTAKATESFNRAVGVVRDAASNVMSAKNAVKDVVPKVETAKETLKTASEDAAKAHETVQKAQDVLKNAVESHINNDPQTAQKHEETVYDLLTELVPNLESLKNRLAEAHQKAEKLGEAVQPKSTTPGTGLFGGLFE